MVQLGVPEQQLDGLYVLPLLDQPGRHRPPTTVRRTTPYAGIAVQLRDMGLQAVACQVLDRIAYPAHAPLGVQVELVALVRQDQLARRLQASIAGGIAGRSQAPCNPIGQVPIKRLDGPGMAQVDAALPASFCDGRTQADFVAQRTGREQHVLHFDLRDFSHAHASRQAQQQDQTIALWMPAGGGRDAEKVADLPRLERSGLGHLNL